MSTTNIGNTEKGSLVEYDITAAPRDFTPAMIVEYIDSGIMEIPLFQRNFVWDMKKASRLIESMILGLPVPELFLYSDDDENSKLKIIDGQQRILSIYFFVKGRFPKSKDTRISIRESISDWSNEDFRKSVFADNNTFIDFQLVLEEKEKEEADESKKNRYEGIKYDTLDSEMKIKFRIRRSLRGVIIRQNKPDDSSSSMFEIFNRLNTGGIPLKPQEIRASLFYCDFYQMLIELNENEKWRKVYGDNSKDLNFEDIEMILRALAIFNESNEYKPTMETFLNRFSKKSMGFKKEEISKHQNTFLSFLDACEKLPTDIFRKNGAFHKVIFESVFYAASKKIEQNKAKHLTIDVESINALKENKGYAEYNKSGSASSTNMRNRLDIATKIVKIVEEN